MPLKSVNDGSKQHLSTYIVENKPYKTQETCYKEDIKYNLVHFQCDAQH